MLSQFYKIFPLNPNFQGLSENKVYIWQNGGCSQVFIGMPGQHLGLILVKCKSEFYDASRSFDCGIS